jgi:hypothetical protein
VAVVVTEHQAPHAQRLRGGGDGRERRQWGKLVAERLRDKMVADQKRREARHLGAASRFHQLLGRAYALAQESEPKRARIHPP